MKRAVFLDRDGVLNRAFVRDGKPYPPDTLEQLEILPGVAEALAQLRAAGFLNVVVTNQPDVATGRQRSEVVEAMNAQLMKTLLDAARELGIDVKRSYMIGDRWRDVAAGQAAGCKCYFVESGYAEQSPGQPYVAVKSLPEAAGFILRSDP
jgi:D-glycero-D-manno-heptose 1,7-bisphosphate phosphatase